MTFSTNFWFRNNECFKIITFCGQLFEEIIQNCNNLTHIKFGYGVVIDKQIEKFIDKFGHKLISLDIKSSNKGLNITKASNIEELIVCLFEPKLTQIKFNRLKKFKVFYRSPEVLDSLELFLENNSKTLKHLDISSHKTFDNIIDNKLLKIITKAKNLVHLNLDFWSVIKDKIFINYWIEIAINCKQIKSLKLLLRINENMRINKELLSILKQFKRLKRLDLHLFNFKNEFYKTVEDFHPFKDLKGLEGLTHFSFDWLDPKNLIEETFLTDIDINFPKLKTLKFNNPFVASEWTAQVLSRLSCLERIYLFIRNLEIETQIERQLIKNCKHFIKFNYKQKQMKQ